MKEVYVIVPEAPSELLSKMISASISTHSAIIIDDLNSVPDLRNKKIIFAIELNDAGFCLGLYRFYTMLGERGSDSLSGSIGAVLIHGKGELFTKTEAQNLIFHANLLGCRFPGRPIVEATGSLNNLLTMQKVVDVPLEDVCIECCKKLGKRIVEDDPQLLKNPKILVLHSSNRNTSNTLRLWDMVKANLSNLDVNEIHIVNGTVKDCIGCPYKTCKHYGQQTSCFYGGIMVEEIYPAILEADAVVLLCPNYNDAISANMSAVINRLTALFRKTKFYDKTIFGVIVSGNSGSDALAKQLISALNINKTFRLPPYFSIMATANDKGAIEKVPNIRERAKEFASNMLKEIKA